MRRDLRPASGIPSTHVQHGAQLGDRRGRPDRPSASRYRRHEMAGCWPARANGSLPSSSNVGEPVIPARSASSCVAITCRSTSAAGWLASTSASRSSRTAAPGQSGTLGPPAFQAARGIVPITLGTRRPVPPVTRRGLSMPPCADSPGGTREWGICTECGMGRAGREEMPVLLDLHRQILAGGCLARAGSGPARPARRLLPAQPGSPPRCRGRLPRLVVRGGASTCGPR